MPTEIARYRGIINFDYTGLKGTHVNAQAALKRALMDLGWELVETSAFAIETEDLASIWAGIGLVAKQDATICAGGAALSALTFHIQGISDHVSFAAYGSHPNALATISERPLPGLD